MFEISPTIRKRLKGWKSHHPWIEYPPLAAFAVVSIGPSASAVIRYLSHMEGATSAPALLYLALGLPIVNWPFLKLHLVCRQRLNEKSHPVRQVRLAMWISLVAMLYLNAPFLIEGLRVDLYDGLYMLLILSWAVPIFGLVGWTAGRLIVSMIDRFIARVIKIP